MNSGLPKDPTLLADKERIKEILLNHVVLGHKINLDSTDATGDIYYSLANSELVISKEAGKTVMAL